VTIEIIASDSAAIVLQKIDHTMECTRFNVFCGGLEWSLPAITYHNHMSFSPAGFGMVGDVINGSLLRAFPDDLIEDSWRYKP